MWDFCFSGTSGKGSIFLYFNPRLDAEMPFRVSDTWREKDLNNMFPTVQRGGAWEPEDCIPIQHVSVIVPYRDTYGDRHRNLMILLRQLHTLLQLQKLKYQIYVINQVIVCYLSCIVHSNILIFTVSLNRNIPCATNGCKQTYSWGPEHIDHREQTHRQTRQSYYLNA